MRICVPYKEILMPVGFSRNQTLRCRLACKMLLRSAFGLSTCGREGKRSGLAEGKPELQWRVSYCLGQPHRTSEFLHFGLKWLISQHHRLRQPDRIPSLSLFLVNEVQKGKTEGISFNKGKPQNRTNVVFSLHC